MAKWVIDFLIVEEGEEYEIPEGAKVIDTEEIPCAIRGEKRQYRITLSVPKYIW